MKNKPSQRGGLRSGARNTRYVRARKRRRGSWLGWFALVIVVLLAACPTAPEAAPEPEPAEAPEPQPEPQIPDVDLSTTTPVAWGIRVDNAELEKNHQPDGGEVEHLAEVRLVFRNVPEEEEGEAFTLIGGGLRNTGFHGPNASGFEGIGLHFAEHEDGPGHNPVRDEGYKEDYTRTVEEGRLEFTMYYEPTTINDWGARYFPGCEVALTMMRAGTEDRVLHADDNEYNWAIAGVGEGNAAELVIDLEKGAEQCALCY